MALTLSMMTSVCPSWGLEKICQVMSRYGIEELEPRVGWGHAAGIELGMSPKKIRSVKACLDAYGHTMSVLASGVRMGSKRKDATKRIYAEACRIIDLAEALEIPMVRTFGGTFPMGTEMRVAVEHTASMYNSVLEYAVPRNIALLLETHDQWSTAASVRAVFDTVDPLYTDHGDFTFLWDIMHPQRMMEKPADTYRILRGYISHVHVHDVRYDIDGWSHFCIPGEGVIDHKTPLELIKKENICPPTVSIEMLHDRQTPSEVVERNIEAYVRMLISCGGFEEAEKKLNNPDQKASASAKL